MIYAKLLQAAARGEKVPRAEFIKCIEEAGFSNDNGNWLCYWMNGDPTAENNECWTIMSDNIAEHDPAHSCDADITIELEG